MKITTVNINLICGMMLGFEYVGPEMVGAHTLILDLLFVRIMIQHGEIDEI